MEVSELVEGRSYWIFNINMSSGGKFRVYSSQTPILAKAKKMAGIGSGWDFLDKNNYVIKRIYGPSSDEVSETEDEAIENYNQTIDNEISRLRRWAMIREEELNKHKKIKKALPN